eukprot:3807821-Lingulodinium_polyedra.AAC.1
MDACRMMWAKERPEIWMKVMRRHVGGGGKMGTAMAATVTIAPKSNQIRHLQTPRDNQTCFNLKTAEKAQ